MPMVRAMRMLNAVEVGTLDGAELETLLADPGRLGEWQMLMSFRGQTRRMAASSTAMAAVIASPTAMAAVIASPTAMAAVAASPTAMAAVAASPTAMAALRASAHVLQASSSLSDNPSATMTISMAASSATNIEVTPGATGKIILVGARVGGGTGEGSASPLIGFIGGTTTWEWTGGTEVLITASAVVPDTGSGVSFKKASHSTSRSIVIYYIPV